MVDKLNAGGYVIIYDMLGRCRLRRCTIIDCNNRYIARGFCEKHYRENYCKEKTKAKYRKYYRLHKELRKSWANSENGKISISNAVKKYQINNSKRVKAWSKARAIKASPCIVCASRKVDRHHPNIKKPLEVIMLCRQHHKDAHRKMLYYI